MAGTSCKRGSSKKTTYIDWDEYFMAFAFLAAKRSKIPYTQIGACIVNNDKRIVSIGYNEMPTGCNDDKFPWKTCYMRNGSLYAVHYVCHAEVNAVLNTNTSNVKDCTIYVSLFPCNECAKVIIQSGIKTVIYVSDKYAHKLKTIAAKRMFDAAGVMYRDSSNRTTYIDWDEYFMAFAFLAAKRSKSPYTKVGACIVNNDKRIVGTGYNEMPTGCGDDKFPWKRDSYKSLYAKCHYVCHAEVNAVLNKNSSNVKNCTIYVSLFPCNQCAKVIIESGIKTVIYVFDRHAHKVETIAAKRMFDAAGVMYRGSFKRTTYIDWDKYFMAFAFLAAKRSKSPHTKVGACIVSINDKRIVGTGYNDIVCHAEVNAVNVVNTNSCNVKDCIIYVSLFPCSQCAKVIIQSGIKIVIYMFDKHAYNVNTTAKRMFDAAGVMHRQYIPWPEY